MIVIIWESLELSVEMGRKGFAYSSMLGSIVGSYSMFKEILVILRDFLELFF